LKIKIKTTTWREFLLTFIPHSSNESLEIDLCKYLNIKAESTEFRMLKETGILNNEIIKEQTSTPAEILQTLLEKKWKLEANDLDQVVMIHELYYTIQNQKFKTTSYLEIIGNESNTAMGKTVGLPLAIAVELFIKGEIKEIGVQAPTKATIYEPILKRLNENGIRFNEVEMMEN